VVVGPGHREQQLQRRVAERVGERVGERGTGVVGPEPGGELLQLAGPREAATQQSDGERDRYPGEQSELRYLACRAVSEDHRQVRDEGDEHDGGDCVAG
jgi:hypothetical protein